MYQIPEKAFRFISEHPDCTLRDICIGVRGRFRRTDLSYFKGIINSMCEKGMIYEEMDGHWYAYPITNFEVAYYSAVKCVDPEDILDYLTQVGRSSTAHIDNALGYGQIRGSYPMLKQLMKNGRVAREKEQVGNREIWQWYIPEDKE